jgi:hypothetical protein
MVLAANGPQLRKFFAGNRSGMLAYAVLVSTGKVRPRRHHTTMGRNTADVVQTLDQIMDWQRDVISRDQALRLGITADRLRNRLRPGGSWQRILPGVYGGFTGTPTPFRKLMAAQLYGGAGAVITGSAALECHRIWRPSGDTIDILIAANRKRRDHAFVSVRRTTRMPARILREGRFSTR